MHPVQPDQQHQGRQGPAFAGWGIAWLCAAGLYFFTASSTIQWQDYGQFALRIATGELFNDLGLALAHPIHFWLGQLAVLALPVEPAHAVSWVSAFAGAVTIANVFGLTREVTSRWSAAGVAAGSLMVANTFWRMSTMPECYTVTTAILSGELWCAARYLLRRDDDPAAARPWLWAMMLLNGLGLANHNLALLTLPVCGLLLIDAWRRKEIRIGGFLMGLGAWFVGASPYLCLVLIQVIRTGEFVEPIRSALFGDQGRYSQSVMNSGVSTTHIGRSAAFTILSFANLGLPLAVIGVVKGAVVLRSRILWLAWVCAILIHLLFVLRYDVIDQHTFLLPAYTLLALFIGLGLAWLLGRVSQKVGQGLIVVSVLGIIMAPAVYMLAAETAKDRAVLGDLARHKPFRDDYRFLFVPWGAGEVSAQQMSELALDLAGEDAIIVVEDPMAMFAVEYSALMRGRSDLDLRTALPEIDTAGLGSLSRPVVWVPRSTEQPPPTPPQGWVWRAEGPLFLLQATSQESALSNDTP